jgi:hypothetical protein
LSCGGRCAGENRKPISKNKNRNTMHYNRRTSALLAAGVLSVGAIAHAEEKMTAVQTALSSTTLSGYVSTSAIWRPGTSSAPIPGRAFDGPASKQDGFNLDVVSLTISKPVDEGDWGAGYVAQMWFGPDAVGFNTSAPNAFGAGGDVGVKQAFVDLHAPIGNGLDIKLGHFNYIGGYEMPDAGDNPNYSRSFAWTQEPASHTGLLLTYKVCDAVTLMGGVANTFNNGVNWRGIRAGAAAPSETEKTYMGMIMLTAPESWGFLKGATLNTTVVNGLNNASGDSANSSIAGAPTPGHQTSLNVSATTPTPVTGLKVGLSYDYTDGFPGKANYADVYTLYLMYQATEKLKLNARAEYTSASTGFWYAQAPGATPHGSELLSLTGTVDYSLWANVISRLEVRWDHSLTGDAPYGGTFAAPGGQKNVVTIAANIIYKF